MDVPDVPLQIGRYAERSIAVATLVGLFARVSAQMSRQIGRTGKVFAAILTGVAFRAQLVDLLLLLLLIGGAGQIRNQVRRMVLTGGLPVMV